MIPLKLTLIPRSAFGTSLKGDTLFGQLCWAIVLRFGEKRLEELLQGYCEGRPFAVVSDAFPAGFLPLPSVPLHNFRSVDASERKQVKKRRWLPIKNFKKQLQDWLDDAWDDRRLACHLDQGASSWHELRSQPHNTIHRLTGTTGTGEFAPYALPQICYLPGVKLDVYLALDTDRIEREEIEALLNDIGQGGYGRDASIGLGRFQLVGVDQSPWPRHKQSNAWMTLAPSAPQGLDFDPNQSWYQPFTRFGRHGGPAVHSGRPFKTPVLLADTGAVFTPKDLAPARLYLGQGLGGDGSLSKVIPGTVHQGYAPVLPIRLEEKP